MRQLWLLPDVLHFPLSCCVRLTLLPTFTWMGSSLWRGRSLGPYSCVRGGIPPRTPLGSNRAQLGWAKRRSGPYSPLGHGWALCGSPGPFVDFGEFHPYSTKQILSWIIQLGRSELPVRLWEDKKIKTKCKIELVSSLFQALSISFRSHLRFYFLNLTIYRLLYNLKFKMMWLSIHF